MKEEWFIILMEDCFVRRSDIITINKMYNLLVDFNPTRIGRYDLTKDIQNRPHSIERGGVVKANDDTNYRVSMQPSIWNRRFLLKYLTPGLTPWQMEKQDAKNDGWKILGLENPPLKVNEGVRKSDPHKLDLNGFPEEDVKHIQSLL
jgi:hypothetical protein